MLDEDDLQGRCEFGFTRNQVASRPAERCNEETVDRTGRAKDRLPYTSSESRRV